MGIEIAYPHIKSKPGRPPSIRGTSIKLVNLIAEKKAWGWSPEELRFQYPGITLGQIRDALAYYRDHKAEREEEIERRIKKATAFKKSLQRTEAEFFATVRRRA